MTAKPFALICLSALFMTVCETVTPAQSLNPSSALILPEQAEAPISPGTPGTGPGSLTNQTTGTNPLTGLPCSGAGALSESGAGQLPDASTPPPGGTTPTDDDQGSIPVPALNSVFGSATSIGAC
jgi:hypothetical protein